MFITMYFTLDDMRKAYMAGRYRGPRSWRNYYPRGSADDLFNRFVKELFKPTLPPDTELPPPLDYEPALSELSPPKPPKMNLTELSQSIHAGNKARGFYDHPATFPDRCMLIVSEIAEAVEAHRSSKTTEKGDVHQACRMSEMDMLIFAGFFRANVKDTVEDELADAVIRLLDLAGYMEIDIDSHIRAKLAFNATRGTRHGKAY